MVGDRFTGVAAVFSHESIDVITEMRRRAAYFPKSSHVFTAIPPFVGSAVAAISDGYRDHSGSAGNGVTNRAPPAASITP